MQHIKSFHILQCRELCLFLIGDLLIRCKELIFIFLNTGQLHLYFIVVIDQGLIDVFLVFREKQPCDIKMGEVLPDFFLWHRILHRILALFQKFPLQMPFFARPLHPARVLFGTGF